MVPTDKASELLEGTGLGSRGASARALSREGRVLEVSGRSWVDNEFECCNSRLSIAKDNNSIKLKKWATSGRNKYARRDITRSIPLGSGIVFQLSGNPEGDIPIPQRDLREMGKVPP
jgi:hypothetical protein